MIVMSLLAIQGRFQPPYRSFNPLRLPRGTGIGKSLGVSLDKAITRSWSTVPTHVHAAPSSDEASVRDHAQVRLV
jgi:hypothetical protein